MVDFINKNKRFFKPFKNAFFVISIVFAIWMLFFDTNSWFIHNELNNDIKALENEKLDLEYFAQIALDRINEMRKQAAEYADQLKQGKFQHKNLSIDADILAPVFIIP